MAPTPVCDYCGQALPAPAQSGRGRPRRWCSDACRRAAWIARHDQRPVPEHDDPPTAVAVTAQGAVERVLQSPSATVELLDRLAEQIAAGETSNPVIAALIRAHRASVGAVGAANGLRPFRR